MIDTLGRVMLYVKDPRAMADFWVQQVGFVKIGEQPGPGNTVSVEISPTQGAETTLVLFDREAIAKYEPELSLGIPSLLFSSRDLEGTHRMLRANGVKTGDIVEMPGMRTFNFADGEENYYSIREVK